MNAIKAKLLVVRRHWTQVGEERERERIIKRLVEADTTNLTTEELKGWYFALTLIKGETNG
jgi:hypothetical protein